jgi:N-acetylmuramate 1-kinase
MDRTANVSQSALDEQERFLSSHGWQTASRSELPGDFSARTYVRLNDAGRKALLMVVPRASELASFLSMQVALAQAGVRVPAVYASQGAHGLALIEDLGDVDFTAMVQPHPEQLYTIAVDALAHLHRAPTQTCEHLPRFTPQVFLEQVGLFLESYAAYVMKMPFSLSAKTAFENAWRPALERACAVPSALMLRDYHAANIMFLKHETGHRKAAVIDFQDGGLGPISYDLASLLEDARLDVSPALRTRMMDHYLNASSVTDTTAFMASYHILACQRHMRILGILAKRWAMGGAPIIGEYFRRVWNLMMLHQSEPVLTPVYQWLDEHVPSQWRGRWSPSS